jgi:hypothetical protein
MPHNSEELKAMIREKSYLFWYTPENEKENISHELLLEHILNYGTLDDVRKLFKIMGIDQASKVFMRIKGRNKLNFYPEIYNFFSLLFQRYA